MIFDHIGCPLDELIWFSCCTTSKLTLYLQTDLDYEDRVHLREGGGWRWGMEIVGMEMVGNGNGNGAGDGDGDGDNVSRNGGGIWEVSLLRFCSLTKLPYQSRLKSS